MPKQLKKGFREFIVTANSLVEMISVNETKKMLDDSAAVQFIDARDRIELIRNGIISGVVHASRGMLEFLVNPNSSYYNKNFTEEKKYVLYCMSGWRSTLAAYRMQVMGFESVYTLEGGFTA